jgi:hypothetical protein
LLFNNRIPIGLRFKIWQYASQPRQSLIEMICARHMISPCHTPPKIFHVNKEAREEGTRGITKLFFDPDPQPPRTVQGWIGCINTQHREVHLDFQSAVIYLRHGFISLTGAFCKSICEGAEDTFDGKGITIVLRFFARCLSEEHDCEVSNFY